MQRTPMTVEGHAALDSELKNLKSVERPAIIQAISVAREHGDLSENAEYHAAKEKQSFIEGRIMAIARQSTPNSVSARMKLILPRVRFPTPHQWRGH